LPPFGAARVVVRFYAKGEQICSGVAAGRGVVLTAGHCVEGYAAEDLAVSADDGELIPVEGYALQTPYDAAVVLLSAPLLPPPWVERVGPDPEFSELLYVVGYGCSGQTKREMRPIRFRAPGPRGELIAEGEACHGDSGGGVFNAAGELLGITYGITQHRKHPLVYATPVAMRPL
jgi:S1-C subfamily serine protease